MGIKEMTPKNISLNCRFICLNLREIESMKDGKFPSQENFIESHYDKILILSKNYILTKNYHISNLNFRAKNE